MKKVTCRSLYGHFATSNEQVGGSKQPVPFGFGSLACLSLLPRSKQLWFFKKGLELMPVEGPMDHSLPSLETTADWAKSHPKGVPCFILSLQSTRGADVPLLLIHADHDEVGGVCVCEFMAWFGQSRVWDENMSLLFFDGLFFDPPKPLLFCPIRPCSGRCRNTSAWKHR